MKIFISQPMRGKTEQQILDERMKAVDKVSKIFNDEEVIIAESYQKIFIKMQIRYTVSLNHWN